MSSIEEKSLDYDPADYDPADYHPIDYDPADYHPIDYDPADYHPIDYDPADYDPADYDPADYESGDEIDSYDLWDVIDEDPADVELKQKMFEEELAKHPHNQICPSILELEKIADDDTNYKCDKDEFDYIEVENIKIYTGTTPFLRKVYNQNIDFLKQKIQHAKKYLSSYASKYINNSTPELLTYYSPSTFTVTGALTNVSFNEQDLIQHLPAPTGFIRRIDCNFGSKLNPNFKEPPPQIKSNRGRKPKNREQSNRKTQGSGKCMNSQITFSVIHPETKTQYKIKVLRNGSLHIPGALNRHMLDLIKPIKILCKYLNENKDKFRASLDSTPTQQTTKQPLIDKTDDSIRAVYLMTVMRDYKCSLVNERLNVNIGMFNRLLEREKYSPYYQYYLPSILDDKKTVEMINSYLDKKNDINLAERSYNADKAPPFSIKLQRPGIKNEDKKTTVKLLKSGKLNFDGANSDLEVCEIFYWTYYIYLKYFDKVIVDRNNIKNEFIKEEMEAVNLEDIIFS